MTARERVLVYLAARVEEARDPEEVTSFENLKEVIANMTDSRFHSTTNSSIDAA